MGLKNSRASHFKIFASFLIFKGDGQWLTLVLSTQIASARSCWVLYPLAFRLVINHEAQNSITMTVIQDPIEHFKKDNLEINFRTGEVVFKKNVGQKVELLSWKD